MANKTYTLSDSQLETLADYLISECCIQGIRNAGGRWNDLSRDNTNERLQRRLVRSLNQGNVKAG